MGFYIKKKRNIHLKLRYRLIEQIVSSSSSIFLNIAEGYGRGTTKDYIRFLYISRGSLYETVSMIEFFKELNWIDNMKYQEFHEECTILGKMLNSLITSLLKKLRNPNPPSPSSPNP